jgi:hypothetical protein
MFRCRFIFVAMLLMSASALAAYVTVPVVNGGFEQPGAGKIKGWDGENGADIPGWCSDIAAFDSGVEGPDAWPGHTDGVYAGFLLGGMSPWGSTYPEPSVWQILSYRVKAGDQFMLSVDSRDNWSEITPAQLQMTLFYIAPGGVRTVLATQTVPLTTTWTTFKLDAGDTTAAVGYLLGVELVDIADPSRVPPGNTWIGIDNVRIPEPATMALLGLGGLSLLRIRKRR